MTDTTSAVQCFPHLKGYGAFLLEHCLDEAARANLDYARKIQLPLLSLLSHMREDELNSFVKQSLQMFLEHLAAGSALEYTKDMLRKWRTDTLPSIPRHGVEVADLVLTYHARRQMLLTLLIRYTTDPHTIIAIARELDQFFAEVEQFAFGLYVDLKEEEHHSFNLLLQEEQVRLEEAYEELRTSREDLEEATNKQKESLLHLHLKNQELEAALEELRAAEEQLAQANDELEARILERTQELQDSELQMRLITDALPVLITYVDADERYRFNNKTYEDWFGRPRTEVYGKKLVEVMGEEAYSRVKDTVQRVLQGETITLEAKLMYKQAGQKHVAINYIPHITDGKVQGYFALIRDISEQKQTEGELQRASQEVAALLLREKEAYAQAEASRSQLYNLFMQAPALLCIVRGRNFVYELANKPYLELLGATSSIIGKPFKEVLPDADPAIIHLLERVMDTGESFVGKEIPMLADWDKNNLPYTRYFNFIYDPIREANGSISGIIGFGYDVSDHVEARQELERTASQMKTINAQLSQRNLELNKSNNDLDNFVYTASHDLRSPVVNLEGLVLALKQHLKNPAGRTPDTVIGMMDTSIAKLNKTIRDLTEITKAQKGLEEPEEQVSIPAMLEELKTDLQQSIAATGATLEEELQVTTLTYAPRNLRSILYNLLTNALKYRSHQRLPHVVVKTFVEDGQVVLSVQDNGLGLDEQQISKLFTMFKRLHTHVEGTGIGLYIIKRIVENSGGKIEVHSKQDEGTLFKVYLTAAGA